MAIRTVGELIEELQAFDPETPVVIHGGGRGATYEPLTGISDGDHECGERPWVELCGGSNAYSAGQVNPLIAEADEEE